jgi:hypothetical protein
MNGDWIPNTKYRQTERRMNESGWRERKETEHVMKGSYVVLCVGFLGEWGGITEQREAHFDRNVARSRNFVV